MPYLRLLEQLLASVPGCVAALLLDPYGEVVVEAGPQDHRYRHRLIGAYQGLSLAAARQATERWQAGAISYLVCRYTSSSLILRPLRDGYYLVMALAPEANVGRGIQFSAYTGAELDAEL